MAKVNKDNDSEILRVDSSLVKGCSFSFDIGGTLCKLAYIKSENEASNNGSEQSTDIHFKTLPRDHTQELIRLVKGCKVTMGTSVTTCGVGCSEVQDKLSEELNISIDNVSEMLCFVHGFNYLVKNFKFDKIVYPKSDIITKYVDKMMTDVMLGRKITMRAKFQTSATADDKNPPRDVFPESSSTQSGQQENRGPYSCNSDARKTPKSCSNTDREQLESRTDRSVSNDPSQNPDFPFPCLLVIVGSSAAILDLQSDGSYKLIGGLTRAGKTFLGLGYHLTKAKSFDELIDLAKKGNSERINVLGKHVKKNKSDVYATIPDEMTLYNFGQLAENEETSASREDLAAGLLSLITSDIAQIAYLYTLLSGRNHVFFAGGFPAASQLVRDEIGKDFDSRKATFLAPQGPISHYFLRHGGYLGALGALLKSTCSTESFRNIVPQGLLPCHQEMTSEAQE